MILNATGKENSVWRLNFTNSGPPSEQIQKAHQPRGTVQAKADLPMRNGRNSGLQRTRCLWKCRRCQIRKRCFSLLDIRQLRSRSYYKGLFVLLRTCSQLWWREAGQNIQRNASVYWQTPQGLSRTNEQNVVFHHLKILCWSLPSLDMKKKK